MQMEKKNDLVKYNNIMNQIAFTKFTTTDYNFLMMLCSKLRNQETNKMVFSFKKSGGNSRLLVAEMKARL